MIERIYILCLIIIIDLEVWTITYCLGFGHETMVCAVCLSISYWYLPEVYYTGAFYMINTIQFKFWEVHKSNLKCLACLFLDLTATNFQRNRLRLYWKTWLLVIEVNAGAWNLLKSIKLMKIYSPMSLSLCLCRLTPSLSLSLSLFLSLSLLLLAISLKGKSLKKFDWVQKW